MKKILALCLVLLLSFSVLVSCQNGGNAASSNRLEEIMASGKLVVATSPDFAPSEFVDTRKQGQEQYVGVDMEFARYIANELGLELEIKPMDFSAVLTAVPLGAADLAISGLAWQEERAESMELSDNYNIQNEPRGQGILIKKEDAGLYKTAEDFAGKLVAVQETSLQKTLLEEQVPGAEVKLVAKINDGVMMLLTDKVDAVGVAGTNGETIVSNYPDLAMSDFWYDYSSDGPVIGMKKGETELCAKINEIVKKANDADLFPEWRQEAQDLAVDIGWEN